MNLRQVAELREDVHVTETVYGNDWTVGWGLLDVEQGVAELVAVSVKEVDGAWRWGYERE